MCTQIKVTPPGSNVNTKEETMSIAKFLAPGEDPDQYLDGLEEVPSHKNDLGDWCPYGADGDGARTADGTCPIFCRSADEIVGFDAGRDDDDDEDETEGRP